MLRTSSSSAGAGDSLDEPPSSGYTPASPTLDIEQMPNLGREVDIAWLRDRFARAAACVADSVQRPLGRLSVIIVNDERMAALHAAHLGCSRTTDVLSFDLSEQVEPGQVQIEADLAICADEAARRAAEFGHSIERELLLYAVHGLLHCVGFDDQDEAAASAMHAEEDRILQVIGVGATYRPERDARADAVAVVERSA